MADVEQALDRYRTLTGWSEALLHAGAGRVAVVQRFHRDMHVSRNGVDYFFRAGSAWRLARAVSRLEPDIAHVNGLIFPAATWLVDVASRDLHAERARLAAHFTDALSWDAVGRRALEICRKVAAGR